MHLSIETDDPVVAPGEVTQLRVLGVLSGGREVDLTAAQDWTLYRSSNPAVLTVDGDGLATGVAPGIAFVTASNEGAAAVQQLFVDPGGRTTTVEGLVLDGAGRPVAAEVRLPAYEVTFQGGADGRFVRADLPATLVEEVQAFALLPGREIVLLATGDRVPVIPGGVTDVGIVTPHIEPGDRDGDCLPDEIEGALGLLWFQPDSRRDGVLDGDRDGDGDGIANCEELALGLDPTDPDTDFDGLDDGAELAAGANPLDADTDDDRFGDGDEVREGADPLNPASIPDLRIRRISSRVVSVRTDDLPRPRRAASQIFGVENVGLQQPPNAFAPQVGLENEGEP